MSNIELVEGDLTASFSIKEEGQYVLFTASTEVKEVDSQGSKLCLFMQKENFSKFVDFLTTNRSSNEDRC